MAAFFAAESVGTQVFIYTASPIIAAIIIGIGGWLVRDSIQQRRDIRGIKLLLAENFGPNSGGLREQVNKTDEKVDKLDAKVDVLATDVATLQGREAQRRDDRGRFVS